MKLLHKTTKDYLIASISILILTGVTLFAVLKHEIGSEMNEQLLLQADEIYERARTGRFVDAPLTSIVQVPSKTALGEVFSDTMVYDRIQREFEEYYYLRQTRQLGKQRFQIIVMTSHIGWDRYYLSIFYIFLLVAVLLTVSGVAINYFTSKHILKPFLDNLRNVSQYSVSSNEELQLHESSITEFRELNRTLRDLTARSRKEYLALREFTENASHEIQTPLSIIRSKLDRMSQLEISPELAAHIVQARSGVDRLSKTNRSLLLLAKLDNRVFDELKLLDVESLLTDLLVNMEDLFESRQINVEASFQATWTKADPYLLETLISNLVSNALRYTVPEGRVKIRLNEGILLLSNTAPELEFDPNRLFERFSRNQNDIRSTGLGLAIAREICSFYGWQIRYKYLEGAHRFEVVFNKE